MNRTRTGRTLALCAALLIAALPVAQAEEDALTQGMNYFKSGKYGEAAADFQSLVDTSPNYDFGYFMLGLSFLGMHKPKEAETSLQKAIELNGDKFEYHHGLARAYFEQKQYAKAIATLRTAEPLAQTDKHKMALYILRGNAYVATEKWGDAVEDLEKARAADPNNASILVNLGQAYYALGHYDKAAPVFRKALQAVPNDQISERLLAESLLNLGAEAGSDAAKQKLYDEALQYADKYSQQNPSSYEAHNLVGRAALGAGKFDRAEQGFRKVLAQKPDYCYAMANLGKTYIAQARWADAETILKDAATCAPRMAVVYESLGFAIQKQQRLDEAIQAYEKAMQIKPSESVRSAIETCRTNLEIAQHNKEIEQEQAEQDKAAADAQAAYEEALRKQQEWEERRKKDE